MDNPIKEADFPVCILNNDTLELSFNQKAERYIGSKDEIVQAVRLLEKEQSLSSVHVFDNNEILLLKFYQDGIQTVFLMIETGNIEKSLSEIEMIKNISNEMDVILNTIHDDILITDGKGIIIKSYPSFEKVYNIKKEDAEGRSIYDLEKEGVFKPSITAMVLERKEEVTMLQENSMSRKIIVTATPIMNKSGEISKVISFSRDLTDYLNLKKQYEIQEEAIQKYAAELEELREKNNDISGLVANSRIMKNVINTVDKVAVFDANIILEGESGVGKTMIAKIIHTKSLRAHGPFIEINCGSIPENLLESELFGYEKGAFTGASDNGKVGLIQLADKGTLFLDEIGELPLNLQTKLLKVIQDKKITRIGGTKTIEVDFRLITATNQKLEELTAQHAFREDLYYRLNVIYINVPPLRERKDDIFILAISFLNNFNRKYHLNKTLSPDLIDCFMSYDWPGNIRELENLTERLVLTSDDERIDCTSLPENIRRNGNISCSFTTLDDALEQLERQLVMDAYKKHKTTTGVAKELAISQPTAVRKIKKYLKQQLVFRNE